MARPLRIERPGTWYHVTGRGTERGRIFQDERDRRHWLELVGRAVEMWGLVVYAYVQMDNHYHLMLETREANLGRAMQWLNVSYAVWFNRRHRRVGPLFQGRYKAIVVDRLGWGLELSRYVHLNPVRIGKLGLDKAARQADRLGVRGRPQAAVIRERLERLRQYRWSSYRSYVGLEKGVGWVERGTILELGGGGSAREQRRKYQQDVEEAVREGLDCSPWEHLKGQLLLGSQEMWEGLRRRVGGKVREQPQARWLTRRASLGEIIAVVEGLKGEKWEEFRDRHGDWGRDLALYLGRRRGGIKLTQLGLKAGGMDYAAVSAAVKRMERRAGRDGRLAKLITQAENQLLNLET